MLYDRIIILDDSVVLKHHWINDEKWEQVMAFPRGGLTYLIQNNAIKFFLTNDYFYRNTVMSLELPLYIVDETMGIDGEYSDITELTEILDRIFPSANGEVDLTPYLKKAEAEELYQPIGDYLTEIPDNYVTDEDLDDVLEDYLTKDEAAETYQPIGEYLTKESGDTLYQPIGNYLTEHQPLKTINGQTISGTGNIEIDCSGGTVDAYTKAESDARFQPIGDYALKSDIPEVPSLDGYATETWVQNQGYINHIKTINNISLVGEGNIQIGSGGTIDAYTKEEADERFQPKGDYATNTTVIQYITNLQQQITSILEAVSGCCSSSGETIYRWITMTGENDYICSGTTKYAKEKKQQSTDNGMTWTNVVPAEYRSGSVIETDSADCGYVPPTPVIEYRWVTISGDYVCSGTTKYNKEKKQYRVNGGAWQDTYPLETRGGSTVIEYDSTDCGYVPTPTSVTTSNLTYNVTSGANTEIIHSSVSASTLEVQLTQGTYTSIDLSSGTQKYATFTYTSNNAPGNLGHKTNWLSHSMFWRIPLTSINVGEGIVYIDDQALTNCSSLTSITLPSTITGWTSNGIANDSALTTVTVNATTPPTIANETLSIYLFTGCPNLTAIKVPASAVDTYKNDASWGRYASIIQAI